MSITATLIIQMIVFLILVGFTMKFIWPPITAALDERARKVAEGLSAADKARSELASANKRIESELAAAREDAAKRLASAERLDDHPAVVLHRLERLECFVPVDHARAGCAAVALADVDVDKIGL